MLPVSRNSSTNMMTAMSPRTSGSRDVMASTLSRLTCAVPVMSTCLPAGVGTACRLSSCVSERSENSGAVLSTVRKALPSAWPAGADGGPASLPETNVPTGAETAETSVTRDRFAA